VSERGLVLVDRDKKIIREIDRWRVVQGRHIRALTSFQGERACDRRLRKLVSAGYIKREKILYGVAGIYSNTLSGAKVAGLPTAGRKIRLEQIFHDISVLETAIYFNGKYGVAFEDMQTEIELHRIDGFGIRKHRPDFVFTKDDKKICVEVELTLKSKDRFIQNIYDNFMKYDTQFWIVPDRNSKIAVILNQQNELYPNIEIIEMKEVEEWKI